MTLGLPVIAGCGALEELDAAAAMMDNSPKKAETTAAAEAEAEPKGLKWDNVKSIHAGELDDSFVRCKLGGTMQFMKHDACRARGGRPEKV